MAEAKTDSPMTLSEQYLLEKEKQDAAAKTVEVKEVENPATESKEVVVEKVEETPAATEESTESPPAAEISAEAPPAAEESTEAPPAAEESTEAPPAAEESTEAPPAVEESTETSTEDAPAAAAEESSETAEENSGDAEEEKPEIKLETAPADFRFPTTNQSRHCFTRYVEYHRCVAAKGDDAPECDKFAKYYRSLCPGEWVDRWNEQRENGTFPGPL